MCPSYVHVYQVTRSTLDVAYPVIQTAKHTDKIMPRGWEIECELHIEQLQHVLPQSRGLESTPNYTFHHFCIKHRNVGEEFI